LHFAFAKSPTKKGMGKNIKNSFS